MSKHIHFWLLAGAAVLWANSPLHAAEWEQSSPYYEDDAWYDISEWLDGNDYNPTDEVVGRWDDEMHDANVASTDTDSDLAYNVDDSYGYDAFDADDNWFYDYYDYDYGYYGGLDDGNYSYSYHYYDYDNDGLSDAYSSYRDTDGDGIYEDYEYFAFNSDLDVAGNTSGSSQAGDDASADQTASNSSGASHGQQQSDNQEKLSSKRLAVSGSVERTKRVKVPQGPMRLIAEVKGDSDQKFLVDLGAANQFGWDSNQDSRSGSTQQAGSDQQASADQQEASSGQGPQIVKQGEQIVAHGPAIKVGDKQLVLAQTVKLGDATERQIVRSGRSVSGKIASMKTAEVRGLTHQLAILDLQSGKQALVDLGRQENLPTDLAEGDQIQVTGMPTKVKDRLVLIANSVTKDGDKTQIERMTASAANKL